MHFITYHELDKHIETFTKRKIDFFQLLEDWSKLLDEDELLIVNAMKRTFSSYFDDITTHFKMVKSFLTDELEHDIKSFVNFLETITPSSDKIFSEHEHLKEKLTAFDNEFKKHYSENESKDVTSLSNLLLARDAMYVSRFISGYYQIMMPYFEGEILISTFVDKVKKKYI